MGRFVSELLHTLVVDSNNTSTTPQRHDQLFQSVLSALLSHWWSKFKALDAEVDLEVSLSKRRRRWRMRMSRFLKMRRRSWLCPYQQKHRRGILIYIITLYCRQTDSNSYESIYDELLKFLMLLNKLTISKF